MHHNYRFQFHKAHRLYTSGTSSLLGIDLLDVFSLGQGTLVGTETSLGKLVHALIGRGSSSLDHIQNSAFIGCQSNNLTGNFSAQKSSFGSGLVVIEGEWTWKKEVEHSEINWTVVSFQLYTLNSSCTDAIRKSSWKKVHRTPSGRLPTLHSIAITPLLTR